jgi:hypothetical protein
MFVSIPAVDIINENVDVETTTTSPIKTHQSITHQPSITNLFDDTQALFDDDSILPEIQESTQHEINPPVLENQNKIQSETNSDDSSSPIVAD